MDDVISDLVQAKTIEPTKPNKYFLSDEWAPDQVAQWAPEQMALPTTATARAVPPLPTATAQSVPEGTSPAHPGFIHDPMEFVPFIAAGPTSDLAPATGTAAPVVATAQPVAPASATTPIVASHVPTVSVPAAGTAVTDNSPDADAEAATAPAGANAPIVDAPAAGATVTAKSTPVADSAADLDAKTATSPSGASLAPSATGSASTAPADTAPAPSSLFPAGQYESCRLVASPDAEGAWRWFHGSQVSPRCIEGQAGSHGQHGRWACGLDLGDNDLLLRLGRCWCRSP